MSDEQAIDFVYNFELRGDRQVERASESMIERLTRVNSVAGAAGVGLEKLGRIFEVGLPFGLVAAGAGIVISKFEEEKEEAFRSDLAKLSDVDVRNTSLKELTADLDKLEKRKEDLDNQKGLLHSLLFGNSDEDEVNTALDKVMNAVASKHAEDDTFKIRQIDLEEGGNKTQAEIEKLRRDTDAEIAELTAQGSRRIQVQRRDSKGRLWTGAHAFSEVDAPNVNQPEIDSKRALEQAQIRQLQLNDPKLRADRDMMNKRDESRVHQIEEGHEARDRAYNEKFEAFKRGNETDAREGVRQKDQAQAKYNEDAKRFGELSKTDSDLEKETKIGKVVASHSREMGGGGRAFGGLMYDPHVAELKKNNQEMAELTKAMQVLARTYGLTGVTPTL